MVRGTLAWWIIPANHFAVFLGEHNSVKLGDFGLSKIMQSHDFASTYVGTPFYMSPEICAAEKYTLKSDIWALGCIMYELCSKEPPFNAKTHYDLVKRIKAGIINPLPSCYSLQLGDVIKSCLTVNPDRRPDTAALFDLPAIQMMRKEKEVVELSNMLKSKEALAMKRVQELEEQLRNVEVGKVQMHQEIEASLRREWEVKAQLEINRLVQIEMERLQKKYDQEVKEKVEFEVQKRLSTNSHSSAKDSTRSSSNSSLESDIARLSVGTNDDESGFHSSANLTDLSTSSPEPVKVTKKSGRTPFTRAQTMYTGSTGTPLDSDMADPSPVSTSSPEPVKVKKSARTPFGRAQTMFIGTPLDVEMADPSPVSIASLALSPRRNGATKAPTTGRNIFAAATTAGAESRWQSRSIESDGSDDDDELPPMPSPTRAKVTKNPFKSNGGRPPLISQKTAPVQKPVSQPNIFTAGKTALTSAPELRPQASNGSLRDRSPAPVRRLSKIPSSSNLNYENNLPQSPTRKLSMNKGKSGAEDLSKLVLKNNMAIKSSSASNLAPKGRTLVELAQARAGGRSLDGEGNRSPDSKGRAFAQRMADQGRCAEPPVWDPERDDMPSPFLNRNRAPRRL